VDDRRKDAHAKNEVLFREVNEQVDRIDRQTSAATTELASFLCECSSADCLERVTATRSEYEGVRSSPIRFLLAPGHERPEIETVVQATDRYVVVEKLPGERTIPKASDPRGGSS
jgi:hypothetical protein